MEVPLEAPHPSQGYTGEFWFINRGHQLGVLKRLFSPANLVLEPPDPTDGYEPRRETPSGLALSLTQFPSSSAMCFHGTS